MQRVHKNFVNINNCILRGVKQNSTMLATESKKLLTLNDIPKPKQLPFVGTKLDLIMNGGGKRLHEFIDNRHKKLGPIFREKLGGTTELVFISDPEYMKTLFINIEGKYPEHVLPEPWVLYEKLYGFKRGLFFMDGEEWLSNRRIMNRHLLREDSQNWLDGPIKQTIHDFIQLWRKNAEHNSFVPDLEAEFYKLSTKVILGILLGCNNTLKFSRYHEDLLSIFSSTVKDIFTTTTKLYGLPLNLCHRLKLKVWTDFKESVDKSLLLARKISHEIINKISESTGLVNRLQKESMDEEVIMRIITDFVIAAGDTTAYTTLWILQLLAQNKDVQNELRSRSEQTNVKNVVKESMRLYPVAPFLTRILPKESVLGPYKLHAGTFIIASIYTSGRDEQNFSKADKFLPHRWDRNDPRKNNIVNHVPSASLPFALGSRSCIGKKIAMIQLSEIISQIVNNFEMELLNSKPVEAVTCGVLIPDNLIQMQLSLRK